MITYELTNGTTGVVMGWTEFLMALVMAFLIGWLFKTMLYRQWMRKHNVRYHTQSKITRKNVPTAHPPKYREFHPQTSTLIHPDEKKYAEYSHASGNVPDSTKSDQSNYSISDDELEKTLDIEAVSANEDLKIVEGIGPKIEQLLNQAGIYTWHDLAKTEAAHINKILKEAGPRFSMHNPETWNEQAELAHEGRWDELHEYQDYLNGGKK